MKRMLPYRGRQWTCQWLWGKKRHELRPKNIGKNDKTFPNHSPAVQHQTTFLICQQSLVRSQWMPSIPHLHTYRVEICCRYTLRMQREKKAQCTILSLCCEWAARTVWALREQKVKGERYICVCVLSWWGEGQCMTGNAVYYLWKASPTDTCSLSYLCLVYYCRGSRYRPAAEPESRYHQPTSLIGARMQIIPVFILIDDYIRKQPAVK